VATKSFNKIHSIIWRSERFLSLDTPAKLLMFYFMTCEHQTSAGAYRIPDGYAAADLRWPLHAYLEARGSLIEEGMISFDDEAETVYVRGWFKLNPPMNEKHAQGTRRLLETLDSQTIYEEAIVDFEEAYASKSTPVASAELRHALGSHLRPMPGGRR
jgi:hypothetical protein